MAEGLIGNMYGHNIKLVDLPEVIHYLGTVLMDGLLGANGDIPRRWRTGNPGICEEIVASIFHSRWLQIKCVFKLCNNDKAIKPGEEGYDPAYKYDLVFRALTENTNFFTFRADYELTGDETTWAHGGWAEAKSGVLQRIANKPGITKGGQIFVMVDREAYRLRAYSHRHKLHPKNSDKWTQQGSCEMRRCMEYLDKYVGRDGDVNILWTKKFHTGGDNFFSGQPMLRWAGKNGFPMTVTSRRDRLPPTIEPKYLHKEKTNTDQVTKSAMFLEPVVAIEIVDAKEAVATTDDEPEKPAEPAFMLTHVSFQSTSSTNIAGVNNLNACSFHVRKKERGKGANKRVYGIENNDARELYLGNYHRVDAFDHMIKICGLFYISWKYWHSAMLHGFAMAVVTAYDFYLECASGSLDPAWKVETPVSFYQFRVQLARQMLAYDPKNMNYPGEEKLRCNTQKVKKKRAKKRKRQVKVTKEQYKQAKKGGKKTRLCRDLTTLEHHIKSFYPKNGRVCADCASCTGTVMPISVEQSLTKILYNTN